MARMKRGSPVAARRRSRQAAAGRSDLPQTVRGPMNGKLIWGLSLFGVAMGFATVFAISPRVEPFLWLPIFVICGLLIARQAPRRPFLHGLLLGVVNSVWVTGAHLLFFRHYLGGHRQEAAMMISAQAKLPPKWLLAGVGPVIGVISGAVIGVLAYVFARAIQSGERKASQKSPRRDRVRA